MSDEITAPPFENDHNVYILGAGFSAEAGYPLIPNFMSKMRETASIAAPENRKEIEYVLNFRLEASSASYRIKFDPENIEDLFSLAAASDNSTNTPNRNIIMAIADTLEYCNRTTPELKENFPGIPTPPLDGFGVDNESGSIFINLYDFFIGFMTGKWGTTPLRSNSFITFNYDLVLEKAFMNWEIPFRYDGLLGTGAEPIFHTTHRAFVSDRKQRDAVSLLKLHGSVNWAIETISPFKIYIHQNYPGDLIRSNKTGGGDEILLAPPIWDKGTARIGHPLSGVWEQAIKKLQTATRIVIIGYSLPMADSHFKYLMGAGLQKNISLKEIIFVDPALDENHPNRKFLEEKIFGVFREDLGAKGILKFYGIKTSQFLLHPGVSSLLNRSYPKTSGAPARFQTAFHTPPGIRMPYDYCSPLIPESI